MRFGPLGLSWGSRRGMEETRLLVLANEHQRNERKETGQS